MRQMMAWDLEEQLGVELAICSYPEPLQRKWREERIKRGKTMATKPAQVNLAILKEQTGQAMTNLVLQNYTQIIMQQGQSFEVYFQEVMSDLKALCDRVPELKKILVLTDEGYSIKAEAPNASKG